MVRIILVAVLVVLGMTVLVLGLALVDPDQALKVAKGALGGVVVAAVLVAAALARVLAEEVQELEALVLQAAPDQAVRDQVNLQAVKVKEQEDQSHPQAEAVLLKEEVQTQEQLGVKKIQPQPRAVSRRVAVMAALAVAAKEVADKNKKADKKK